MKPIRIILVDDHRMIREGMKAYLSDKTSYTIIGEAENGQECLDLLENLDVDKVDLILTDLSMPVMDGLELVSNLKKDYPEIKVLALTMMSESEHVKGMISAGVEGYLLKNCGGKELIFAIKEVMDGGTFYSSEVNQILKKHPVESKPNNKTEQKTPTFSYKEKAILKLALQGFSSEEIIEELNLSPKIFEALKRNLLFKIGKKDLKSIDSLSFD